MAIGIDIETGGHVFQLHFSNATGMNERAFITETTANFIEGEIRFGFNLSRVFQLKKKKSKSIFLILLDKGYECLHLYPIFIHQ